MLDKFKIDYPTDGRIIGLSATDAISFHGATPVAQRANAAQASVATTAATSTSPFGFTSAQANGIISIVNEIRATLVEKGLWKGSA
jgi:hypothetical protein